MSAKKVVVIGGGLAGISAALELKLGENSETEVVLLEARNRLGGLTWSFEKNGVTYDNGQHVFLRCCDAYLEFLDRVGSSDSVYLQPRLKVPVVDMTSGKPKFSHISRWGKHLFGLFFYKHLSFRQKLRAIKTALKIKKLDPADESLDEISFGEWLMQRGETLDSIEKLWDLFILPTVNVSVNEASLKLATKVFITGILEHSKYADIGWGLKPFSELHNEASQNKLLELGVEVVLNAKVEKLEFGEQHKISTTQGDYVADAIILAVPHNQMPDIEGISDLQAPELELSPILNIHFVFDRQIMKMDFLAGLGTEVQYVFDRTQAAGLDKNTTQCLAISLSGADKYLGQNAKDLEKYFYEELLKIFPKAKQAELLHSMVTRENAATFKGIPGSHAHRAKAETKILGVFLAGAWTDTEWPATMEGAIRSGKRAAELTVKKIFQ